jgi:fatty acid desaturase
MAEEREPLEQVRRELEVRWYRCPIEPQKLRALTRRSDLQGFFQTLGHVALLCATGLLTVLFFARHLWGGVALSLFAHGTIFSFLASASHELTHGTVFRTKGLNTFFLYALGLVSWFNPHDFKLSHTYHHLFTLHPRGDGEVVLPTTPSLHPLWLLQLFTVNVVGWRNEPYTAPVTAVISGAFRLAFTRRHGKAWMAAIYADQEAELGRAVRWARVMLVFHGAVIAAAVLTGFWPLALLVTGGIFTANWLRYFLYVPMHTGLKDDVDDFRLCTRTITLDPFTQFIYWRMNWHTEHHMFAAVPCYNLHRLHREVAADMPLPRTLVGAWREIRETWRRQQVDPSYHFVTPLPARRETPPRQPA